MKTFNRKNLKWDEINDNIFLSSLKVMPLNEQEKKKSVFLISWWYY